MPGVPGQRHIPTPLLKLRGSIERNPARYKDIDLEPQATGELGKPPLHLTKDQKKVWKEIVSQIPPQVATNCDRTIVEVVVREVVKMRTDQKFSGTLLMNGLQALGMTPMARTRIHVPKEKTTKSEWSDLLSPTSTAVPSKVQ